MRELCALNKFKAAGPERVHQASVAQPYNPLLRVGKIPEDYKTAIAEGLYKGRPRHGPENYGPVSLGCVLCKHVMAIT